MWRCSRSRSLLRRHSHVYHMEETSTRVSTQQGAAWVTPAAAAESFKAPRLHRMPRAWLAQCTLTTAAQPHAHRIRALALRHGRLMRRRRRAAAARLAARLASRPAAAAAARLPARHPCRAPCAPSAPSARTDQTGCGVSITAALPSALVGGEAAGHIDATKLLRGAGAVLCYHGQAPALIPFFCVMQGAPVN